MKEFKYKTKFSGAVSLVDDTALNSCISKASLDELQKVVLPESLDLKSNYDILGTVFNAAVVNRINKNGDGIDSATAISIAKHFVHKPQNLEHKRNRIVGCNVGYAWSEIDSNIILTDDDIKGRDDPYNLVLVGAVWKSIDPKFASMLIEASDPESDSYMSISTSWELGFDNYVILKGSDVVENGTIIEDQAEIERLTPFLKVNGGSGFDPEDGQIIGRIIRGDIGSVLPYGIGYTTNPAAHVKGVAIIDYEEEDQDLEDVDDQIVADFQNKLVANLNPPLKNLIKNEEKHSPNENLTVTNNKEDKRIMSKFKTTQELIDMLPEESRASATEFIAEQIKLKSKEFEEKIQAKDKAIEEATQRSEKLQEDVTAMQETLNDMVAQAKAKEAELQFNERMGALHEEFELSEADLKIVVEEIRGLNEEDYTKWYDKFSALANDKKKSVIAAKQEELDQKIQEALAKMAEENAAKQTEQAKNESTASEEDVENNLDDLEEDKSQAVANANDASQANSLRDWAKNFGATMTIDGKKIVK